MAIITYPICRALMIVLLLFLDSAVSNNRFEDVKSCPANEEAWNNRAQMKSCQEPTPDFMCAANENQPGKFGEICTIVGLSSAVVMVLLVLRQCAVLDADTYNLNFIPCSAPTGCPTKAYKASEVYKYPVCYNITFRIPPTSPPAITDTLTLNKTSMSTGAVYIAITTIVVFFVVFLAWMLFMRRKKLPIFKKEEEEDLINEEKKGCKNNTSYTHNVSILVTYLKYRLVAVCDLTDLKNKMLLHSKALKSDFEQDFQTVMHVTTEDNLKLLGLNIVYNLLTNFGEITEPKTGWGHKPDVEDISHGADIERIRIIVNSYLDGRYCDNENAAEIITRWTTSYGEINPSDTVHVSRESKISYMNYEGLSRDSAEASVQISSRAESQPDYLAPPFRKGGDLKIKPDCIVKCGVVVTDAIENILEQLKLIDIVVCRGAIGCGKTTALDFVTAELKKDGWEIEWTEELIDQSCFDRVLTSNSNKTVLCCDNYCGSYGCQVFSEEILARNDHYIKDILSSKNDIKVLIGIHKHVYDEITSKISKRYFFQDTGYHIDLDNLSDTELLWLYKLQEEKSTSKQNPVSFKNVLAIRERRPCKIGNAFQAMMMCSLPDTFFTKAFCNEPFQILTEHFKKLIRKDAKEFKSLLYVMCTMLFDQSANELNPNVVNALGIDFDIDYVQHYVKNLAPYIKIDDNYAELKHELIGIAIFHTYLEVFRSPLSISKACDVGKILELARPEAKCPRCHPFAIPFSRPSFESVRGDLETRIKNANISTRGHPLFGYMLE